MESNRKTKGFYILLSILVAAAVWFFVDEYGNNGSAYLYEKTIEDIPVEYRAENGLANRGLMLLEEGTTSTVDITFEGGRRLLSRLERSDVQVTADLSSINNAGMQTLTYKINYSHNRFDDLTRKSVSPSLAVVNISELAKKVIDVRCELIGNVADGYSAGALQLEQDFIEVRGLEKDLQDISYAKITLDIGTDAVETVSQDLICQFYDAGGRLLDTTGIHPSADSIRATLPIFVTKELRLTVDFMESAGLRNRNLEVTFEPETILVSGEAGKLRGVETIVLDHVDLLALMESGIKKHTYSIIIPDGCQNLSGVTRATMEVHFKDLVSARIPATQITYTNLPDGKNVEILTTDLRVTVYGTAADVASVMEESIFITADLSEYSGASGTYSVPAKVTLIGAGDVGVSGEYEVKVNIQEPQEPDSGTETAPDLGAE